MSKFVFDVARRQFVWLSLAVIWLVPSLSSGQVCPNKLLYTVGNQYFYNAKNCVTGQMIPEIYVYNQLVSTGCGTDNCATTELPHTVLLQPAIVGDPPGGQKPTTPFRKAPADANIMVEFGNSPISTYSDFPKFVTAISDNEERTFKIFKVSYKDDRGQNQTLQFGIEVEGVLPGKSALVAESVEFLRKRVRLNVRINGRSEAFEALYEMPTDEENGGSDQTDLPSAPTSSAPPTGSGG